MARTCGVCRNPVRWDEGLTSCWLERAPGGPGYYVACVRCRAKAEGWTPPAPRRYPASENVPPHPTRRDCDLPICGLCREALFEGEATKPMRLRPADCEAAQLIVEEGVYRACPRCLDFWRPFLRDRLLAEGVITEGVSAESLRGSVLL